MRDEIIRFCIHLWFVYMILFLFLWLNLSFRIVHQHLWWKELHSIAGTVASWALFVAASRCSFVYLRVIWDHHQFFSAQHLSITFLSFWSFSFWNYPQALFTLILQHSGQSVAFPELFVQWVLIRYLILGIFGRHQF